MQEMFYGDKMEPLKKTSNRIGGNTAEIILGKKNRSSRTGESVLIRYGVTRWWEVKKNKMVLKKLTNVEVEGRTLFMRLHYVLSELDRMVMDLEQDAANEILGTRTREKHTFAANALKTRLKAIRQEITGIRYIEVD